MDELFNEFSKAHASRNGYELAQTLSPVASPNQPHKLTSIWKSTNAHSSKGDIKHFIKQGRSWGMDMNEVNGWVEVYYAYWKAVGEIIAGETGKVGIEILVYQKFLY